MRAISRLVVQVGGRETLFLRPGQFVIGRRSDCDLILDRRDISRRHAVIVQDAQTAVIEDLASRNGVRVNGIRVEKCQLDHGAVVQLGSVSCLFEWVDSQERNEDAATPCIDEAAAQQGNVPLTVAESRVLALVLCGFAEKVVAARLGLSRHTIHNHIKKIYTAFGVNSRAELLALHLSRATLPRVGS